MTIGVYVHPESMTNEQYDDAFARVAAAGLAQPAGRLHHIVFGKGDDVRIFDIWATQAAYDSYAAALQPILDDAGLDLGPASIDPVHMLTGT